MIKGISASKGYAIGQVVIKINEDIVITEKKITDVIAEKNKLNQAIELTRKQLNIISEKAEKEVGKDNSSIFESHKMFLDDPEFIGMAELNIETNMVNAEKAFQDIVDNYISIFSAMEDEYMRERGEDIRDVGNRIQANLAGKSYETMNEIGENTVVVARDLTPSDTAQLDKTKVIAFLTDIGGRTSHTAIMARTLEIPAVVGMYDITARVKNGDKVIVDGCEGIVIINPDDKTLEEYKWKKSKFEKKRELLKEFVNIKAVTKNGKQIKVVGNIGKPEDVFKLLENGADGIGLFRTEFLYMDRDSIPTEDEQFESYKYVTQKMGERSVVIRTLDIGGDKKLSYLPMDEEMNPFLGYRAIRLCLGKIDIFKAQLRALLRASSYGNLKIMFPMISSIEEFLKSKEILKECMQELKSEGKSFNEKLETGIMVEIPAAAVCADELAKHVDFFSIGTNDLIQYTIAADRMNEKVAYLYNPMHPAVLKLIKMTIKAAHAEGKWCGMCGEMAGDETAVPILLEYGLDEFSMSASSILNTKKLIINN